MLLTCGHLPCYTSTHGEHNSHMVLRVPFRLTCCLNWLNMDFFKIPTSQEWGKPAHNSPIYSHPTNWPLICTRTLSFASTSAPLLIRNPTISVLCLHAAMWSGVIWFCNMKPSSIKQLTQRCYKCSYPFDPRLFWLHITGYMYGHGKELLYADC